MQEFVRQTNQFGSWDYLYLKDLQQALNVFNSSAKAKHKGMSITLSGEAESYAYYAFLDCQGLRIPFLIYTGLLWGTGRFSYAPHADAVYHEAWNLWIEVTRLRLR